MAEIKEPRKRKVRRNYSKEFERLCFYLDTVIRIKDDPSASQSDGLKGELRAYRDIQDYVGGAK